MSAYLIREATRSLSPGGGEWNDTAFVNQRFDGQKLVAGRFAHCTFANVSFLEADLRDCYFTNCVFERCYFRRTKIHSCHFPASRFVGCEFVKPQVHGCDFRNARFERSVLSFAAMEPNLPGEPNLCRDLCNNLAIEAGSSGFERDARRYRLEAIRMHEEALRRGYRWSDDYSKSHYPEFQRVSAFIRLTGSRLNGAIWGHGEYLSRLLGNLLLLAFVIGPVLLVLARSHLHGDHPIGFGDCVALSVASVLNSSGTAGVDATGIALVIVLALTASGLVFLGLFVTYLFRAVTRR